MALATRKKASQNLVQSEAGPRGYSARHGTGHKSKAMDRVRPPRPALKFGEKGLVLIHTPPTYASHVALYLHDADEKKRFLRRCRRR